MGLLAFMNGGLNSWKVAKPAEREQPARFNRANPAPHGLSLTRCDGAATERLSLLATVLFISVPRPVRKPSRVVLAYRL